MRSGGCPQECVPGAAALRSLPAIGDQHGGGRRDTALDPATRSGPRGRRGRAERLLGADASPSATEAALPPLGPPDLPMPVEARTQDAAGAEAFVRYYIDLINRTSTVMDAAPLREFSHSCADCNRIATATEE